MKEEIRFCPTCDSPCTVNVVETEEEMVMTHVEYNAIIDETMLEAVAVGRLQTAADTCGHRVEMRDISESMPTSFQTGQSQLNTKMFVVYNSKGQKIGNGNTRLQALQRAFGVLQVPKKGSKI